MSREVTLVHVCAKCHVTKIIQNAYEGAFIFLFLSKYMKLLIIFRHIDHFQQNFQRLQHLSL